MSQQTRDQTTGVRARRLADRIAGTARHVFTALALAAMPSLAATVSPASLAFEGTSMADDSLPRTVTFTNDSGAPITVSGITVSPDFRQSNNCATLAAGASCTITVVMHPRVAPGIVNAEVPVSGTLTISSSAGNSPSTVALSGVAEKSLITQFYRAILRRAPDPAGKAFWADEAVRMINLGADLNETWYAMAAAFFASAEYTSFNRDDTAFLEDLYRAFFHRTADSAGLAFWQGQLAAGMPRGVALVSFQFTPEYAALLQSIFGAPGSRAEANVVGDFYRGLLARLPDDAGFNTWVAAFRSAQCAGTPGAVTEQANAISRSFVSSPEYAARNRTDAQFVADLYNAFLRRGGDLTGVQFWINQITSGARTRENVRQQFVASVEFSSRVNAVIAQGCPGNLRFISPTGSDVNNGRTASAPFKTFAKAFASMAGGDELVLLDGVYGEAAGTGYISFAGVNSAQPPSGRNLSSMTVVRAQNPGKVLVKGALFLGRSTRKDSFIRIQGITFEGVDSQGAGSLYNVDYSTVKDCGFKGSFGVGTNDHDQYADNNLIEDVWIWARGERVIAINYRSHFNVWRRVVVRGDGCGTMDCTGSGNPNVGITVYDSNNISLQNVIVVDRILLSTDSPYADFAVAQHTPDPQFFFGKNEWLGTISINAPDSGYTMEPDVGNTIDPTIKIKDAVAWGTPGSGINLARAGTNSLIENVTIHLVGTGGSGVRVAPELTTGILRNAIVTGSGRFGFNSKYRPSDIDLSFSASQALFNQTTCAANCLTTNPRADAPGPSQRYLTRIEPGSRLKGAGFGGADIGANVVFRYGADGARFGQPNYNTLTAQPLWPWPNEARIRKEMCDDSGVTRGFCAPGTRLDGVNPRTLTTYVWEFLGNPIPPGIYP